MEDHSHTARKNTRTSHMMSIPPNLKEAESNLHASLKCGAAEALKFGRRGSPHTKLFLLTDDMHLCWRSSSPMKSKSDTQVDLGGVDRVQSGQHTAQFSRFKSKYGGDHHRSLSIVYDQQLSSLNLICDSEAEREAWVGLLEKLMEHHRGMGEAGDEDPELKFLMRQWRKADKDKSDTLDVKEVVQLVQKLNINTDKKYVKAKIKQVDDNGDGVLQFNEFVQLMTLLRARPDLEIMFHSLLKDLPLGKGRAVGELSVEDKSFTLNHALPADRFRAFLREYQQEDLSEEEVATLLKQLDPLSDGTTLRYNTFNSYMNSTRNDAFDPRREEEVYQDMTQPLSHYFVASSHNTYLEGDQLRSKSSVQRYINDLCNACRCVELDCWDGDGGEPIIFHGHTLTTKIPYKAVIEAVRDYSFSKSQYPVILSLENHCSIPQQQIMAANLTDILGDLLYVPESGALEKLPSPEELKGKVVIKGKIIPDNNMEEEEDDEGEDDEDEEELLEATTTAVAGTVAAGAEVENGGAALTRGSSTKGGSFRHTRKDGSSGSAGGAKAGKKKEKHHHKTAPELSRLTLLGGVKFKGWSTAKACHANQMSSFGENKTNKLLAKAGGPQAWVEYNTRMMSRIYPAGSRVDSSNYDPQPSWNAGSQIVALNYQTPGSSMRTNCGKFRDNGGCGYLLKPVQQRDAKANWSPDGAHSQAAAMTISIQVISAQQLPKPGGAQRGEIIDPYVVLSMAGVPADTVKKGTAGFTTKVIDDNGFNPVWNESFAFTVRVPDLALLNLTVKDKDVDKDDFIAYATIPVSGLRSGYRTVKLFSNTGTRHGEFEHCSLFCFFDVSQP